MGDGRDRELSVMVPLNEFVRQIGREAGQAGAQSAIDDHIRNCPVRIKIETCGRLARYLPHAITSLMTVIITLGTIFGIIRPEQKKDLEAKVQAMEQVIEKIERVIPPITPALPAGKVGN